MTSSYYETPPLWKEVYDQPIWTAKDKIWQEQSLKEKVITEGYIPKRKPKVEPVKKVVKGKK